MTSSQIVRITVAAMCISMVAAGCSLLGDKPSEPTATGTSTPATGSTTVTASVIAPNAANSMIVPKKDVSQLVGSDLEFEQRYSNPGSATIDGKESCRSLIAPLTIGVGDSWTTFRDVWYQESEKDYTHAVDQRVLLYPGRDAAVSTYASEFPKDIRSCSGEVLKSADTSWRETVREVTDNRVQWIEEQVVDDNPVGWRCAKEVRIADNLLFTAAVCQRGNGGPAVQAIIDRMATGAKPS